jgi:peptidyl-prolyl cis-trans isomerase D
VAVSMVGYLIPGYGGAGTGMTDNVVAEIGNSELTVREVQLAIRNATRSRNIPPEMMVHFVPQIIDQLINEKALIYQAEQMGLRVTEEETAKAIRESMPNLFPDGKFIGREAYAATLQQQDLSIAEFERYMQRQILLNRLRNVVLESTVVSQDEIEREYRARNEKATVEYIKVDPEKLKAQIKLTPEEMKEFYQKNQSNFTIPEARAFKLVVIDPAKISESVAVTDTQIQRAYDQNKDRFRTPDRVKARHILLMTTGKPPEEEAKLKTRAEELLKQVKGGTNFAELAKANSEDPGSKDKGGDLDWVVKGQTVPEFETALFALKPNEISGVVKTQYGFHIIQALEKEQARLIPLDEVKQELVKEIRTQAGQQQVQATIDNTVAALKKNPAAADQIAAQAGLTVVNVERAGAGDPVPELGVNREFEDSVSGLKKGEVSQPVSAPGDRVVVAVVTDLFPAHPSTFDEAEPQIRSALLHERANRLAEQKATEVAAKVKAAGGADLKKIAQSMGLESVTSQEFSRNGAIEGLGSADGIPEAFTKPVGTIFGPTFVAGTMRVVGKVTGRTEADMAALPGQLEVIRDEIKSRKARERNALFEDGIRQQMLNSGKIKIHEDVLKRFTAQNG